MGSHFFYVPCSPLPPWSLCTPFSPTQPALFCNLGHGQALFSGHSEASVTA